MASILTIIVSVNVIIVVIGVGPVIIRVIIGCGAVVSRRRHVTNDKGLAHSDVGQGQQGESDQKFGVHLAKKSLWKI